MNQYIECCEIVDGRVLSVLTDETLQELGVNKRLHRLVLINKIAKEKARSLRHANLHSALVKLVNAMSAAAFIDEGTAVPPGREPPPTETPEQRVVALTKRVQDLVASLPPTELVLELKAKMDGPRTVFDLLLHAVAKTYPPRAILKAANAGQFADEDLVVLMVGKMATLMSNANSCVNGLRVLFTLLRAECNREALAGAKVAGASGAEAEAGGLLAVCKAMREYDMEMMQVDGLSLLMVMLGTAEHRRKVVLGGGVEACAGALRGFPKSVAVQEYGFAILWVLGQDPGVHQSFVEHKVVSAVIAGMGEHRERVAVQEYGCGLIRVMCDSSENKAFIKAEGGIGAVVKGMVEHGDHTGVQEHGSAALRLMSANSEINKVFREHKLKTQNAGQQPPAGKS